MASTEEHNHSPLSQFEIHSLLDVNVGNFNISFTNSSVAMVCTVAFITLFLTLTVKKNSLVPSRLQVISESVYSFIAQLLQDTVGNEGKKYFPFVFSIFMFVHLIIVEWPRQ